MKNLLSIKRFALAGAGAAILFAVMAYAPLLWQWLNLSGLAIVLGGTLVATCVSYPLAEIRRVLVQLRVAFGSPSADPADIARDVTQLVEMARLWLQTDVRRVEAAVQRVANPFLRTGVEWLINQTPQHQTLELLYARMDIFRARAAAQVQMLRAMAGFAPAFGMLGTVVSLMTMMAPLTSGPAGVGATLTTALMSTCYGLLLANLVFRPLAVRLERHGAQRLMAMNLMVQGIAMMAEKRGPAMIRETLQAFLTQDDDAALPPGAQQTARRRPTGDWLRRIVRSSPRTGQGNHAPAR